MFLARISCDARRHAISAAEANSGRNIDPSLTPRLTLGAPPDVRIGSDLYFLLKKVDNAWDFSQESRTPMTTEEVLGALGRYMKQCNQSDRQTAANLGVRHITLSSWLRGKNRPEKCLLARIAGFLKRVGYLPSPSVREGVAEASTAEARAPGISRDKP